MRTFTQIQEAISREFRRGNYAKFHNFHFLKFQRMQLWVDSIIRSLIRCYINFPVNSCDHGRSFLLYAESLRSNRLWGRQCTNVGEVSANTCAGPGQSLGGEPSNFRLALRGIYRVPTNANSPFGMGPFWWWTASEIWNLQKKNEIKKKFKYILCYADSDWVNFL